MLISFSSFSARSFRSRSYSPLLIFSISANPPVSRNSATNSLLIFPIPLTPSTSSTLLTTFSSILIFPPATRNAFALKNFLSLSVFSACRFASSMNAFPIAWFSSFPFPGTPNTSSGVLNAIPTASANCLSPSLILLAMMSCGLPAASPT